MTVSKQQYKAYAAATQTVARTRQIVMLYDGAIRYLKQAGEAMEAKRIEERYHLLVKVSEIVSGLQGCLDFESGGDVARLLYNFYSSIDLRIFALHRSNSKADCEQLIRELRQMRDVWHDIDQNMSSSGSALAAPSAGAEQPVAVSPDPAAPTTISA